MHFLSLTCVKCLFLVCITWSHPTDSSYNLKIPISYTVTDTVNHHCLYQFLKPDDQLSPDFSLCLLFNKVPFLGSYFSYNRKPSDSSIIAAYFDQNLNLFCFLFPLYFYDPDDSVEVFNYLFTSAVIFFGLLPLKYVTKSLMFKTFTASSPPVPQTYTLGILGFLSGLSLPFFVNEINSDKYTAFSIEPLTSALLGQIVGSFLALLIYKNCQISSYRSTLICSYSLSGMIIGAIFSSINTYKEKNILTGVLLGGWGGFLTASILDRILTDHLSSNNKKLSIMFSLPVITSIPVIIVSKHLSKMNDFTISIAEFKIQF